MPSGLSGDEESRRERPLADLDRAVMVRGQSRAGLGRFELDGLEGVGWCWRARSCRPGSRAFFRMWAMISAFSFALTELGLLGGIETRMRSNRSPTVSAFQLFMNSGP